MGSGHGDTQQGIGAELALVLRAIQRDQLGVQTLLVCRIETLQRLGDRRVDVADRLRHTLAAIARLVAITQLNRLARSGRGATGDRRATEAAIGESDFGLQRGIASRIEDFTGVDAGDLCAHACPLPFID